METVIDDPEQAGPFRSIKVLESTAEVVHATHLNDLEQVPFNGDGIAYRNEEESIALYTNEEETQGILEFGHEVKE